MEIPVSFELLEGVPVPEMLLEVVGYGGQGARFIGLYWEPAGDESYYDDGRFSGTGDPWGYLAYADHLLLRQALGDRRWWLGSSDDRATHMLLVDTQARNVFLVPLREGSRFLVAQWGPPPEPDPNAEPYDFDQALKAVQEGWQQQPVPSMEAVYARLEAHAELTSQMVSEMNDFLQQLLCKHDWQPTDTEGHAYQCPLCGLSRSAYEEG